MKSLIQDARYGLRILLKNPGFTAVALLTLTLGIGASTAIFTVVNAVLLQSLPYGDPGRLVWVSAANAAKDPKDDGTSFPDFADWRSQNHSFEDMAGITGAWGQLSEGDEPETVMSGAVTHNFFSVLGVMPRLGRNFTPDDAVHGNTNVMIISDHLWKSYFKGSPDVIGRPVQVYNRVLTIIGVMPENFRNVRPDDYKPMEFWMPTEAVSDNEHRRRSYLNVIGRLKPGVSLDQAHRDLDGIAARLEEQYPATNTGWRTKLVSLHDHWVGDVRPALLLLSGAVGFLLLIACANLANLMLARTAARTREIAIRAALGAGRRRLIQQLLTESVLLAAIGGAFGVLLAWWGVRALTGLAPRLLALGSIHVNGRVLWFFLIASVVTGIAFGLLPALSVTGGDEAKSLTEGSRTTGSGISGRRVRDLLAAAEVALALVMLIGAGLMIKSFSRLQNQDPGFRTGNLLVMSILAPPYTYRQLSQVKDFTDRLISEVSTTPGCTGAAIVSAPPLIGESGHESFAIEGAPVGPDQRKPDAEILVCSPGYFQMMGIPLLAGRQFEDFDTPDSAPAAVVNQALARTYFSNESPLGRRIQFDTYGSPRWFTIVGIVGDTRTLGFAAPAYPQLYMIHTQAPERAFSLLVRTSGDPAIMMQAVKTKIRSIDSRQSFFVSTTMDKMAADLLAGPKFNMILMTIFAVIAGVIAAVGIYGVISYSVTQRTREIGIRMAIGATRSRVMRLVIGQGALVTLAGLMVGLAGAVAMTRLMSSLLYSVTPTDTATFAVVTALLGVVSISACYIPARRATKVDPMVALRYE